MRQQALESDIVIVNHHLFFADLALRQGDFGSVLPDYSVVVFDEAHEIEDVATQYFGVTVSSYRIDELVGDAIRALSEQDAGSSFLEEQIARLSVSAGELFGAFRGAEGRFSFRELGSGLQARRAPQQADLPAEPYRKAISELTVIEGGLKALPSQSDVIDALARRCGEIRNELTLILESDSADQVYWYDVRGRGVFLWASPIRISPILSDRLFSKIDTAVLTSATLSTGGNFQFIRSRLGLQSCHELIVESPYDFSRQAILYVPRDLPEPKEKNWTDQACRELEKILEVSSGRAFLLFTSYAQMKAAHRNLQTRLPFPLLIQGEKTKNTLLEEFRKTPHAVLFATSSFWQGVDVQGEQLSCVVIDKLPFSVPSDPIVAARIRHLNEAGENAFYEYQIPEAIILLKQGMGRLIRGQSDRGILALLDKRIVTKSYGSTFINSLPSLRLTHDLAEIRNFLKNGNSV
jgi:ATP-dependent DNA helicase DinG